MNWATKSASNLLPLSVERSRLGVALREWLYTGDMYDLETPCGICELCEHQEIRYQFKIINRRNRNEMAVGSECINKFEILAVDALGNVLDRDESRRLINRDRTFLVSEARKRRLINTLVKLSTVEEEFEINSFISYVQDRDAFTPSQLATLFWRLDRHEIEYTPRDFKLVIRRDRERQQLYHMPEWKMAKLWAAMSTTQRTWVLKNTKYVP